MFVSAEHSTCAVNAGAGYYESLPRHRVNFMNRLLFHDAYQDYVRLSMAANEG